MAEIVNLSMFFDVLLPHPGGLPVVSRQTARLHHPQDAAGVLQVQPPAAILFLYSAGISVESAVDVAKDAVAIVLLETDLGVLSSIFDYATFGVLPFTLLSRLFHFEPLPLPFFLLIGVIVLLYVTYAEITKRVFYERTSV